MRRQFRGPRLVPPDRERAPEQSRAALALLGGIRHEEEVLFDPELNQALDPLRLWPALGVSCGKHLAARDYCFAGLGFVALDQQGARIVSGNRRKPPAKRRGGVFDLASVTGEPPRRFESWVEEAQAGLGKAIPTGEEPGHSAGLLLRRGWDCPRCGASWVLKNRTLLQAFLQGIERGDREIVLGWQAT
ncbi:MAG: hypothetical protein ACRDVL_02600 [Acidimicrobiia bacterium]